MTQAALASRAAERMAGSDLLPHQQRPISRCQIAQWENAHRRIEAVQLRFLEEALEVRLDGVSRDCHAPHHIGNFCRSDLGTVGALRVVDRPSGNTILEIDGRR